ncbi:MAG: terminase small subunit, partial [Chloroflexi bacterium]|nr:terminase small subunit [Chloroflexota bacterium]
MRREGSSKPALTARRQRFVEEFGIDHNATRAATAAEYSAKTARFQASRLLTKVAVLDALERSRAAMSERTHLTTDLVVAELLVIARDPENPASARVAAYALLAKHTGG